MTARNSDMAFEFLKLQLQARYTQINIESALGVFRDNIRFGVFCPPGSQADYFFQNFNICYFAFITKTDFSEVRGTWLFQRLYQIWFTVSFLFFCRHFFYSSPGACFDMDFGIMFLIIIIFNDSFWSWPNIPGISKKKASKPVYSDWYCSSTGITANF